jgi:hypothetical protein
VNTIDLYENDVWVAGQRARRVIALVPTTPRARVVYSTGGDGNRACLLSTFERWRKRAKAKLMHRSIEQPKVTLS